MSRKNQPGDWIFTLSKSVMKTDRLLDGDMILVTNKLDNQIQRTYPYPDYDTLRVFGSEALDDAENRLGI